MRCGVRHCRAFPQRQNFRRILPTAKKKSGSAAALQPAFLTPFSAVRGLASATFSIWQSTAEYIPTRPWSLPHWDSVRKGADSAEALDCQSLVSRQNSLVGVLRG